MASNLVTKCDACINGEHASCRNLVFDEPRVRECSCSCVPLVGTCVDCGHQQDDSVAMGQLPCEQCGGNVRTSDRTQLVADFASENEQKC
jgi:hypothetical protein